MFTQTQINEIHKKLLLIGVKDSQIPELIRELNGEEDLVIVVEGKNYRIPINSISQSTINKIPKIEYSHIDNLFKQ